MRLKIVSVVALIVLLASSVPAAENSLVDAVKQKNATAVKALLQKRVDVNAPEGDGATALHWAAYRDDLEMVNLLIGAGARVNVANDLKTGRVMVKDEDVCLHCGLCAERCPTGAWDMKKYLIDMTHANDQCRVAARSAA